MELYQLKTFITVAQERHLTRASERLHTSQPAVSAHIKALEEELGLMLFIRTPKGMLLTREGAVLKEKAEAALATIVELQKEAKALQQNVSGTVRVGINIDPRFLKIDLFLSYMRQHYPDLDFHLHQRWSWQQPDDFKTDQLDVGFVYSAPELVDIEAIHLKKFNVVVVGPANWQEQITGADWPRIAQMPWIWTPPNCCFSKIAQNAFDHRGLKPVKVTVADQELLISTLVTSGIGLSFMMEAEAKNALNQGRIAIWDHILGTVDLSLIYAKRRADDPMVKAVVEAIRVVWQIPSK